MCCLMRNRSGTERGKESHNIKKNTAHLIYKISPHKMYQSTYASVAKYIAVMYDTNESDGDKMQASVLRDCIHLRDNTSHTIIVLLTMRQLCY